MRGIGQTALAVALTLVFFFSSKLAARTLTPDEIKLLDGIASDPEAKQQAEATLNSNPQPSEQPSKKPKPAAKKATPTSAAPQVSQPATTKAPDAITQVLRNNANKPWEQRQYSPCAGLTFILRQNWKDVGNAAGAACPDSPDKAQGAQISFANDRVANNRTVTINGTAALLYNSVTGNPPSPFIPYAMSFGAYTTVNDISNSAASSLKSNIDTLAYGGLLDLGFNTPTGANFFMLRAGVTEDNIKDTTAASAVFDWSPVVNPLYIHFPYHFASFGLPIITRFDPDLVARFDSATGNNQLLAFNNRHDALRLGPELALTILPDPGYLSGPLSRFVGLVGFDAWYETYSKQELWWFTSSLTYNLDEAGNFGIQGTYKRGRDENTGNMTNIYTIGLSGKI
jgi:hypothetical protein